MVVFFFRSAGNAYEVAVETVFQSAVIYQDSLVLKQAFRDLLSGETLQDRTENEVSLSWVGIQVGDFSEFPDQIMSRLTHQAARFGVFLPVISHLL